MPGPSRRCLPLLALLMSGCASQGVPSASGIPSLAAATAPPTPSVTLAPTASPSPTPTPAPTATPDPSLMELEATSCPGGVVLDWSASTHPDFHHYIALRSPNAEIAPEYPPIAPAVDWGDTYETDPFVTSAVDASILPGPTSWNYRVIAYDVDGRVVSASAVRSGRISEVVDLGELTVSSTRDGNRLAWQPYAGSPSCFSFYRVVSGGSVLSVISDQDTASLETDALHPGTTYQLGVQAVRATTLGSFMVAQTATITYTVP